MKRINNISSVAKITLLASMLLAGSCFCSLANASATYNVNVCVNFPYGDVKNSKGAVTGSINTPNGNLNFSGSVTSCGTLKATNSAIPGGLYANGQSVPMTLLLSTQYFQPLNSGGGSVGSAQICRFVNNDIVPVNMVASISGSNVTFNGSITISVDQKGDIAGSAGKSSTNIIQCSSGGVTVTGTTS